MSKQYKPMLAGPADLSSLKFPLMASPKLDGIRCIVVDGVAMSRSLKPIPNTHIQSVLGKAEYAGLDGELICGSPTAPDCYRVSNSGCMSRDGEPDFTFHVFDRIDMPETRFMARYNDLPPNLPRTKVVSHITVHDLAGLDQVESEWLEQGYEGVMLRDPEGGYKFGRSTAKEGILLKLKRMASDEARVIGMVELQHNLNEATTDALGYTQRSSHKENKVAGGVMGTLVVECLTTGVKFEIGTGFTAEDRRVMWNTRDQVIGRVVTYNHFPIGRKDLPRHPSFKGFRSEIDL